MTGGTDARGTPPGPFGLLAALRTDREILVVGGGPTAERKIRTLLSAGCPIRVVAPETTPGIDALAASGRIALDRRLARAEDFAGRAFALLALPPGPTRDLLPLARAAGCRICCSGLPEEGDFALAAQFQRGGFAVGVASGGGDPAGSARLKERIREALSEGVEHHPPEPGGPLPEEIEGGAPMREPDPVPTQGDRSAPTGRSLKGATGPAGGERPFLLLTRGSPLARWQTEAWIAALRSVGIRAEAVTVPTHGDRDRTTPLACFGGFGAFVKALEEGLLAGRGDGAVHSLKDVPVDQPEGLLLAAVLPRGSARDLLIPRDPSVRALEDLPRGARIGTSSLRRGAQARSVRPDLVPVCVRGNVDTRLRKLREGECDALLLAEAGVERLGRDLPGALPLPFLAAPAQGAVTLEVRAGSPLEEVARTLNHRPTWLEISAERAALSAFGRGCALPFAARATLSPPGPGGESLLLRVELYGPEGDRESAWGLLRGGTMRVGRGDPPEAARGDKEAARPSPAPLDEAAARDLGGAVWGVLAGTDLAGRLLASGEGGASGGRSSSPARGLGENAAFPVPSRALLGGERPTSPEESRTIA